MIKCFILDNNSNDQCIIGTGFLVHPDIHAIINFKDNYIKIQDLKSLLKVIAVIRLLKKSFLSAKCNNILEGIREEERQWVTRMVFPSTSALIPDLIIQPLTNNQVATEFQVETAIDNITNGTCLLLFIDNMPNSIKL
uniref:Uncharacterized protein n=1 Tax=Romanomermis culicivorax TaxID=13658 RepID=A0A915KZ21_ROMCU